MLELELNALKDNPLNVQLIGEVEFVNATDTIMHEEFVVFCVRYRVYHGGEDKRNIPDEIREEEMIENFDEVFNED